VTDLQILVIMVACALAFGGYLVLCDRVRR
jgi:hypothetical protein